MKKLKSLKCKECGREFPLKPIYTCEFCFGPLEVNYDYSEIKKKISREKIKDGPLSLWRYWDLLPVNLENPVSINEGFTPLIKSKNLGEKLGLKNLYIKNDSVNPTFSFKDRVVSVATTRILEFGFDTIACASTGNLACSVAAYGAISKLRTFVFIPSDLEAGKILGAGIYAPHIIGVEGNYDQVNRLCSEIADSYKWAFVNVNIRPYYSEGSKTLGFETAEQLGWRAPDHCIVPVASGSLLTKIYKGLQEFEMMGLIKKHSTSTKMTAAQPEGCSPVITAIREKSDIIKPIIPKTIVKSLAIGNPADGFYAWKVVKETGGFGVGVSDDETVSAIKLLAKTEGIFTETAGGVTVAALIKLAEEKKIKRDELVVVYVTGNGLKTQEAVVDKVNKPKIIHPTVESFKKVYEQIKEER